MNHALKLLSTTGFAALLATSALAQTTPATAYTPDLAHDVSASSVLGMTVYASPEGLDPTVAEADVDPAGYDEIGVVGDLLLDTEGRMKAVVIGVGGFLGIGEKDVAIPAAEVRFVPLPESEGQYRLVIRADRAALEAMPAFDKATMAARQDAAVAMETDRALLRRPAMVRDGFAEARLDDVSTDEMIGAKVYDIGDRDIGRVDQLLLADDQTVDHVVLDIGGFLGFDSHKVSLTPDEIQVMRPADGGALRVYLDATKSDLEALPEYAG